MFRSIEDEDVFTSVFFFRQESRLFRLLDDRFPAFVRDTIHRIKCARYLLGLPFFSRNSYICMVYMSFRVSYSCHKLLGKMVIPFVVMYEFIIRTLSACCFIPSSVNSLRFEKRRISTVVENWLNVLCLISRDINRTASKIE